MNSLVPDSAKYDLALQLQACQSTARRNGKVARLPFALRHQINRLFDDGLPYKSLIEKLGPAGRHLTEHNLSNWRLGGYQDYLKAQVINDRARTQTQAAAHIVRDAGHLDPVEIQRACSEMALLQYMDTLLDHGDQIARETLQKHPAKMVTLINACCNLSNTNIALQKRKWQKTDASAATTQPHPPHHSILEVPEPIRT